MTTFQNGPANGQSLVLRLSPHYLRVTVAALTGKIDALDNPNDVPERNEALHVYELRRIAGVVHVRAAKGKGGFFPVARYRYLANQPPDETMRNAGKWNRYVEDMEAGLLKDRQ